MWVSIYLHIHECYANFTSYSSSANQARDSEAGTCGGDGIKDTGA